LAKKKPVSQGARSARPNGNSVRAKPTVQYQGPAGPTELPPIYKKKPLRGGLGKFKKLGLLAAGLGAGAVGIGKLVGDYRDTLLFNAINDIQANRASLRQNEMMRQARQASYQDAIDRNLGRLAQSAPDLYASVAAGRKLPQGGVVIGGAPRQDLLNELGRAMSDGRFSR
jgi:hypothetical protein